jgi:hypothetical protein
MVEARGLTVHARSQNLFSERSTRRGRKDPPFIHKRFHLIQRIYYAGVIDVDYSALKLLRHGTSILDMEG